MDNSVGAGDGTVFACLVRDAGQLGPVDGPEEDSLRGLVVGV